LRFDNSWIATGDEGWCPVMHIELLRLGIV
jgi:hypothetical protein